MAANASSSEVDFTCPICCDIFTDPVVLLCGHSFCKDCLQEWWRQSKLHTCPVCKKVFTMGQPPPNLALRNVSDNFRQEMSQKANSESAEFCSLHNERLKLFCENDKELICLICRDSQKHKKHNCLPVNEAVPAQRSQIKARLISLKTKVGLFKSEKLKCDKIASHIQLQAQRTEKTIKEEFQKLYQFLRAEEAARIDAARTEATLKSEVMNIRIVNLTAEISTLTHKIETVEKDMRADDVSFMRNIKSTRERSQCNVPQPKTPTGALINEAKHLGNLQFTVWNKMKNIIQYTPVTLDPNTSGRLLTISEHMTRSRRSDRSQPFPANPERLEGSDVLGSDGFIFGKHSWDVEVDGCWALGVAVRTKDHTPGDVWGIYVCTCHEWLHELTPIDGKGGGEVIAKDAFPHKVRVNLDYEQGTLSFVDLDKNALVHTVRHTFTETVFPYFGLDAKILPARV